ncbi:uncharacterized protein [Anoplolepis gracilipes]|uniref:uncharacterized protein isoform X2 n=1 Tax=Anoplolepis gracilipes TaxID=354296 RepID=UPI003BA2A320
MRDQVICKNIYAEAQEIKRRLSIKGQDVDETVICELLETLDPDHETNRMEYIINLIMDNQDSDFQKSLDEAGSSINNEYQSVVQSDTKKFPKLEASNSSVKSTETIDVSDSEDDRDYYYYDSNSDDISVIDRPTATCASSCSILDTMLNQNISNNEQTTITVNIDRAEVEFLEKNNNDSNDVIYMESFTHEKTRSSESPKPGCSKDLDGTSQNPEEYCHSCNYNELQIDAKRIHSLLPNFDCDLIYKILEHNQLAKNRIELTLWDLLPESRPNPQLTYKYKRKCMSSYESRCIKYKKNSAVLLEKNVADAKTIVEKEEQACVRIISSEIETIDVELKNEESMPLINKTDIMKMYITEDALAINNMNDDVNNQEIDTLNSEFQIGVASEAKLNYLDTFTDDINMCKIVQDNSEKLDSSQNDTNNDELQLPMNLVVPHKTKIDNIDFTTISTAIPGTAVPNTVMPNTATLNVVAPTTTIQSTAVSSTAASSTAVSSTTMSNTAVPSIVSRTGVLRPARFTVVTTRLPFTAVSSSSKQSAPILKPPKLSIRQAMQNLPCHQKDITNIYEIETTINTKSEVNEEKMPESNNAFCNEIKEQTRMFSSAVNPYLFLSPNKMVMVPLVKTEEIKIPKERSVPLMKPTSSALSLKKQHNDDETSHLRQLDVKSMLQAHDVKKEKQNFVYDMEATANKLVCAKTNTTNNTGHEEIILNEAARKIYYKLIPMFPSVDTAYIKRLCQNYLMDDRQLCDETVLQTLAEYLIDNGQKYPTVKRPEQLPVVNNFNTYDLNEQYADLLGIFPEADPMYLRKVAEENYKDPEKIKEFVQSKLENPDYPTRAQYLAKKKITEQQKQYTTDFKIQQFLELFPDPFSHFENAGRQCKFNPHAVDFLKQYFSKIRVNTLVNTYSENLHNLSLTVKALELLSPDMKTRRTHSKMMLTEDIPLLQECAFIQHKVALKKYLTELKNQEEKEFQELKANNGLIECLCCYDNECMPSKCSSCENGHIFCDTCIVKGTELVLADGKAHVDCLLKCGNQFSLSVLQRVLPPTKFSILLCKRQEAEVMAAGLEGLVSCPFCHFASIPPPEDKVFKCLNPNCMKESCRLCKELNHIPLKCNEVKSDVARLYLEEKMTEALVRKCYKCGRTFFKEEGCNKMTCPCGAQMCYICDKPVIDYKHFQGQGVQNSSLCPLWSDDRRMNAESVIKVCHETLKHIKQKNPQVDINVNNLLPKLPPKRKGPHEDVAYANIMPAHAERIARQNP